MLKRILVVVFSSVFLFLIVPLVFLFSFSQTYLSSTFYKGPFLDRLHGEFIEIATRELYDNQYDDFFRKQFNPIEFKTLVSTSFPKSSFSLIVGDIFDKLGGINAQNTSVVINFLPLRDAAKNFYKNTVSLVLDSLSTCADGVEPKMEGIIPSCTPAKWREPGFMEKYRTDLDNAFESDILKKIDVRSGILSDNFKISFDQNYQQFEIIRNSAYLLPFITVGFFLLLVIILFFIRWKPFPENFIALGKLLLLGGAMTFAVSLVIYLLPSLLLKQAYFPPDIQASFGTLLSVFTILIQLFDHYFMIHAVVFTAVGGVLYFTSKRYVT